MRRRTSEPTKEEREERILRFYGTGITFDGKRKRCVFKVKLRQ
jgi:hypothetical protein